MIPTNHKIEILKAGQPDIWGDPTAGEVIQSKGNLRSESRVATNSNGEEVVSNYTILFVGVMDVTTDDTFRFTEPNGVVVEKSPITVKFLRGISGQAEFTKVQL